VIVRGDKDTVVPVNNTRQWIHTMKETGMNHEYIVGLLTCEELATGPTAGLAGNSNVKSASSRIIPAVGPNVAHCQVDILYGTNAEQNINIRVGLPLNSRDDGIGSTDDAGNFQCGGNLEAPEVVCRDVLVKYKKEANGQLDYSGTGVDRSVCSQ
jgi:hypothetical protein